MTSSIASQGNSNVYRYLQPGIYAPLPTFFTPGSEDLDVISFVKHASYLARVGIRPVVAGSMGESIHLSHEERVRLIRAVREVLEQLNLSDMPIIAGTGAGSTRETIELCKQAAQAGADYAIVIISGYFAGALAGDRRALRDFWVDVAENSPIPILIYNYPGGSGGINLDSDLIVDLATTCPNICGVKLTCGDIGKMTRIVDVVSRPDFLQMYPRKVPNMEFMVFNGWTECIIPSVFTNGHGAITGLANLAPHSVAKLWDLATAARQNLELLPSAQLLQGVLACADATIAKSGVAGTKYLLERKFGFGGLPRRPLLGMEPGAAEALWAHRHTENLFHVEKEYSI